MKKIINNPTKKRLIENFFSLSVLQAANYILPLITLPYLVRVLQPEKYGLLAFAQALIQYFNIIADYGFNFSATRELSIFRDDKKRISEIFSAIMILKGIIIFASVIILSVIIFSFQKLRQDWLLYYMTFGLVLGQNMFPRWLFQGLEKMKYITVLNLISKVVFTCSIFIFIRRSDDYLYVPLINSMGYILGGTLALLVAFYKLEIRFIMPSISNVKYQLYEGWHLFISTLATSLYTTSNILILGLFTNDIFVGYYSAAEKIIKAIEDILSPIFHTVYPHLSKLVIESRQNAIDFLRKLVGYVSYPSAFISLLVFFFPEYIVKILLGDQYQGSIIVFKIMSLVPLIGGLNIIFTSLTMLSFNYKKEFSNIIIIAGFFNFISSFLLVPLLMHVGSAISVLLSEFFIMTLTLLYLRKKNIHLLKFL